ncbi:transposase [Rhodobacteraceae bacterium MCCB 386]|nr:transposase [Roseitranquillus sediminis]
MRAAAAAVVPILMEHDVKGLIGAGRYERGDGRQTWSNGYGDHELKTGWAIRNCGVREPRQRSYFLRVLEPHRSSENSAVGAILILREEGLLNPHPPAWIGREGQHRAAATIPPCRVAISAIRRLLELRARRYVP